MKVSINKLLVFAVLLLPLTIFSQAETVFNGIILGNSTEEVLSKIKSISKSTKIISPRTIRFPQAKKTETHIVCANIKTENGVIEKTIFTFADDTLSHIEARGNAVKIFKIKQKDTARVYLDYIVYVKDKLFLNEKKDAVRILNEEGMHMNLFTWENPYFNNYYVSSESFSNKIPGFLKMGENIDVLKPILEANCAFINVEELDDSDPNAQLQINCFGVDYMGFPRKAEARFGNNQLNAVWILTAKAEENRIRKALANQFGKPVFINDDWEIFDNWKVGLRKDKPEVLLLTQEVGLFYKKEYFKQ